MMAPRTLLVIGSGPGIGVHTAIEFARQGFTDIHMLSRNSERLQQEKQQVLDGAGRNDIRVFTHSVDITKAESLKPVLSSIQKFGPIECVFFNAARVGQSQFFDFPVQEIEQDLNTCVSALYTATSELVPALLSQASKDETSKPSFLVTNSMLYKQPYAPYFSLSLAKAAQRTLVQCLAQTYEQQGIHFGLVSVQSVVSEDHPVMNPKNIAQRAWELYDQPKEKWTLEVEIVE